jgi:hypothetical protein
MEHVNVSASQFSTFKSCKRAWAFDKIDRVPRVESPSANEGTAIHAEIENFYLTGEAPKRPESLALTLHLPPLNKASEIRAEQAFSFVWPGQPALVRGFMDLWQPNPMAIWDHKTTSSKRYFKTSDDLIKDSQAICYGFAARVLTDNLASNDDVRLQWTYVVREQPKTRPPLTEAVVLNQSLTMLEDGVAELTPVVSDIVQITKTTKKAADVEPNPGEACFRYGGCPYRDLCSDYAGHKQKGLQMPGTDLLALLRAASNEPVVEAALPPLDTPKAEPAPTPAPPPSSVPTMPPLDTSGIVGKGSPIIPPDAQPNVSENDPPVPPQVETARRGRPKTAKAVTDGHAGFPVTSVPTPPIPPTAPVSAAPGDWRNGVTASLESCVTELIRNKQYNHARDLLLVLAEINDAED